MDAIKIPYGKQYITQEDIDSVVKVLQSEYLTQGPKIEEFERDFAKYVGSQFAVAVSNGTAALHLSSKALRVSENDKIITTSISFTATANCILYCGGKVEFVDIDPDTFLLDLNKVEDLLKVNPPNTFKGVIVVDFAGNPVNIEDFHFLANKFDLFLLEDACHAPGAWFTDSSGIKQYCGNGKYSDLSVFSFHPVKHFTTGEGGMITTNREDLYKKLLNLRSHGIIHDPALMNENHGGWYYEMIDLGYNYRITDIQCALGISQLKRAESNLQKRIDIAKFYDKHLNGLPIKQQKVLEWTGHSYHLYVIESEKRKELYDYLRIHNIFAQVHYIPIHLQPYYKNQGWGKGDLPVAETYYQRCLSLPMYPSLTQVEQRYVIDKIIKFYSK